MTAGSTGAKSTTASTFSGGKTYGGSSVVGGKVARTSPRVPNCGAWVSLSVSHSSDSRYRSSRATTHTTTGTRHGSRPASGSSASSTSPASWASSTARIVDLVHVDVVRVAVPAPRVLGDDHLGALHPQPGGEQAGRDLDRDALSASGPASGTGPATPGRTHTMPESVNRGGPAGGEPGHLVEEVVAAHAQGRAGAGELAGALVGQAARDRRRGGRGRAG